MYSPDNKSWFILSISILLILCTVSSCNNIRFKNIDTKTKLAPLKLRNSKSMEDWKNLTYDLTKKEIMTLLGQPSYVKKTAVSIDWYYKYKESFNDPYISFPVSGKHRNILQYIQLPLWN